MKNKNTVLYHLSISQRDAFPIGFDITKKQFDNFIRDYGIKDTQIFIP